MCRAWKVTKKGTWDGRGSWEKGAKYHHVRTKEEERRREEEIYEHCRSDSYLLQLHSPTFFLLFPQSGKEASSLAV